MADGYLEKHQEDYEARKADYLRRIGCDRLQGYLFSKPVPKELLYERVDSGELVMSDRR